jgi:DNA-binding transcriptional regulator GbsR (MarR family)
MPRLQNSNSNKLDSIEHQMVNIFVDGARILGLPPSIGEIYGLLFISPTPLALDDFVERLGISKGSVSQGLRMLKGLRAVHEVESASDRRTYYEPAIELKRLAGGFIREQVRPHFKSAETRIRDLAEKAQEIDDPESRKFLRARIERIDTWRRSTTKLLPILQKLLGQ